MSDVVFVTGAYGVGKTTLVDAVSREVRIPVRTASELIRSRSNYSLDSNGKVVADKDRNQEILISAVNDVLYTTPHFLLDGHVALMTGPGTYQPIDYLYFDRLSILGIILLEAGAKTICRNLLSRDGTAVSLEAIKANLQLERQHSAVIAHVLGVPHHRINLAYTDDDVNSVAERVKTIMKASQT